MYLANRERKFCPFPGARASSGTPHLSDHDLQCGIDDVIRRTLDEGRVLLDSNCDRLLQSNSRFAISGGLLMIDMIPPSLSLLGLLDAGKTHGEQRIILFTGLERPATVPVATKWGRSS